MLQTSKNIDTTKLHAAIEGIADDLMVDLKEK
jgi:hypothetical protein